MSLNKVVAMSSFRKDALIGVGSVVLLGLFLRAALEIFPVLLLILSLR